ncbi:hypothetical protein EMIT079MI2_100179 [Bacillus sp. IT-79MI2]
MCYFWPCTIVITPCVTVIVHVLANLFKTFRMNISQNNKDVLNLEGLILEIEK